MRQTELTPGRDGFYRRNLGFVQSGAGSLSQPKFNLGKVKRAAQERLEKIAAIWRRVELDSRDFEEKRALWDSPSLEVARAIAAGQTEFRLARTCSAPYQYVRHVEATAKEFPEIRVVPADENFYRKGKAEERLKEDEVEAKEADILGFARELQNVVLQTPGNDSKYVDLLGDVTLHQALDGYCQWVGEEKFDKSENAVNDTGITRQNFIRQIKTHLTPDRPLSALTDFASVDELFGVIRRRPDTPRYKKPLARKSARHLIGELARFFDWLHRSPQWDWRKPPDFEDISHTPIELESDLESESKEIPTYTVDQLRTLFAFATPLERILLALGLNCGYGADQIGRLKIGEIHERNGVHYIQRIRRKQKVRGFHRLFQVTVTGLQWAIRGREDQKVAYVLVNSKGNPLWRKTKGGRRCRDIANAWYRLLNRVCAAKPDFPRHGFNVLRDTSADMIRKIAGEEVASAHLTHKHQSADKNLRRYTNAPWKKVFKAQRKLERKLAVVFEGIRQPWYDGKRWRKQSAEECSAETNGHQ